MMDLIGRVYTYAAKRKSTQEDKPISKKKAFTKQAQLFTTTIVLYSAFMIFWHIPVNSKEKLFSSHENLY